MAVNDLHFSHSTQTRTNPSKVSATREVRLMGDPVIIATPHLSTKCAVSPICEDILFRFFGGALQNFCASQTNQIGLSLGLLLTKTLGTDFSFIEMCSYFFNRKQFKVKKITKQTMSTTDGFFLKVHRIAGRFGDIKDGSCVIQFNANVGMP